MDFSEIVAATLGISHPWQISSVALNDAERRLDITITCLPDTSQVCPHCGARGVTCATDTETWYHHDFFNHTAYLHARIPHIRCCGRSLRLTPPWPHPGSRFVKLDGTATGDRSDA